LRAKVTIVKCVCVCVCVCVYERELCVVFRAYDAVAFGNVNI